MITIFVFHAPFSSYSLLVFNFIYLFIYYTCYIPPLYLTIFFLIQIDRQKSFYLGISTPYSNLISLIVNVEFFNYLATCIKIQHQVEILLFYREKLWLPRVVCKYNSNNFICSNFLFCIHKVKNTKYRIKILKRINLRWLVIIFRNLYLNLNHSVVYISPNVH